MSIKISRLLLVPALIAGAAAVSGCSTVATMAQHSSLESRSQVSNSIFLEPLSPNEKTVFIQIKNTSDKNGLDIRDNVAQQLTSNGWTVVRDPDDAMVLLQANVLQAGKAEKNAIQSAMDSGYGGGVIGSGAAAAGIAAVSGGGLQGSGVAALAGGAADYVGGLLVKNVYYAITTDVQILRRGDDGEEFEVTRSKSSNNASAAQQAQNLISMARGGSTDLAGSQETETYTETSEFKRYQTRVLASAEKVNLDWEDAAPVLREKLVSTIGGIL